MKLQGKNIIVTGASRGFGAYLVSRLWKEGASLLLVSRNQEEIPDDRADQICRAVDLDLTENRAAKIVMKLALLSFSDIHGLVNNAASQGPIGSSWENNRQKWSQTILLNLQRPVDLCNVVVPHMLKQGHGKIVNLSGGGATSPRPNYSAYATAKAGLVRFSECLAAELKGTGIDVNCVAPGKMPTGMLPPGETPDENSMEKAADLIVWLLSEDSNGFTGRLISAIWDHWKVASLTPISDDLYTLRRIDEDRDYAYRIWKGQLAKYSPEGANNL